MSREPPPKHQDTKEEKKAHRGDIEDTGKDGAHESKRPWAQERRPGGSRAFLMFIDSSSSYIKPSISLPGSWTLGLHPFLGSWAPGLLGSISFPGSWTPGLLGSIPSWALQLYPLNTVPPWGTMPSRLERRALPLG